MPKILGIEIGNSRIRICEEDYKTKNPKVYNAIGLQTPQGVMNDGVLDVTEELVSAIKGALAENKIKTKQIIFSMNSTKIASREIVIPYVKENKIKSLIEANVADYFPVDLQQYEIGHTITGVSEGDNGMKQYKVVVYAVPLTIIHGYFQLANALGCDIAALDYSGNSIYQIVRRQCDMGVQMVVKIDESTTMVTVLQDQQIVLQRTVAYGAEDAAYAIMEMEEYNKPDYVEAVRILREKNCMDDETISQSLSFLVSGISRVVDYYTRNNGAPIEKAYVSGFGGNFQGLADIVSNVLELPIEPLREIKGTQLDRYFGGDYFGQYLTCIGAAIAPVGFMSEKEKDKKSMSLLPGEEDMFKVSILVAVAGVVAAGALFAVSFLHYRTAALENDRLENRITELEDAENVYQEFLQQKYTYEKLVYFMGNTVTFNEQLVDFIEEMEEKMPASLNVRSLAANQDGVTMSVTVADKKEAARLIQQFRTFETVASVEVNSLNDTGAVPDGQVLEEEPKVSFTVSIKYKGSGQDNPAPKVVDPGATDAAGDDDAEE